MELKFAENDAAAGEDPGASADATAPRDAERAALPAEAATEADLEQIAALQEELAERRAAQASAEELGDLLGRLGRAQAQQGLNDEALASFREAVEVLRSTDAYARRAEATQERADLESSLGLFVEAQRGYVEAAQAFALARQERECGDCWWSAGDMRVRINRGSGAVEAYEQAAKLYEQVGEKEAAAAACFRSAELLRGVQPQRAAALYGQARAVFAAQGDPPASDEALPESVDDPRKAPPALLAALCDRDLEALNAAGFAPEPTAEEMSSYTRSEVAVRKKTPLPLLVAAGLAVVVAIYSAFASLPHEVVTPPAEVPRPPSVATGEVAEMPAPARRLAEGLLATAAQAVEAGQYDAAVRSYDQALDLFRQGKRRVGEADALRGRAELEMKRARPAEARRFYQDLLVVQRSLGDTAGQMEVMQVVLAIDEESGDAAALRESYEQVLALQEQSDDRAGKAEMLRRLVSLEQEGGRLGEARDALTRLRLLYDSSGDTGGKAQTLERLAAIDIQVGRVARARDQLNQAFVIYRENGAAADQARTLVGLGDIDRGQGRPEQARASYRQAVRLYEDGGDVAGGMATRLRLGDVEVDLRHEKRAAAIYADVLSACEASSDRRCMANALRHLGAVQRASGQLREAAGSLERAAALFGEIDDLPARVEVLAGLAELRGDGAEAERLWAEVDALSERLDDSRRAAALTQIAAAAARSGRRAAARDHYRRALELFEQEHNVAGQMAVLAALQELTRESDGAVSQRYGERLAILRTATDESLRDCGAPPAPARRPRVGERASAAGPRGAARVDSGA